MPEPNLNGGNGGFGGLGLGSLNGFGFANAGDDNGVDNSNQLGYMGSSTDLLFGNNDGGDGFLSSSDHNRRILRSTRVMFNKMSSAGSSD